jgi:hypothetical protein
VLEAYQTGIARPILFDWSIEMMNRRGNPKSLAVAAAIATGTLTYVTFAQAIDTIFGGKYLETRQVG